MVFEAVVIVLVGRPGGSISKTWMGWSKRARRYKSRNPAEILIPVIRRENLAVHQLCPSVKSAGSTNHRDVAKNELANEKVHDEEPRMTMSCPIFQLNLTSDFLAPLEWNQSSLMNIRILIHTSQKLILGDI